MSDDAESSAGEQRGPVLVREGEAPLPDDPAFVELFRPLERDLFRLCRRMLDSSAAADDAVNDVYLRARRAFATYDPKRPFRPWLFGIAGNHCIDQLRRRKIETRIFDEHAEVEGPSDPGPSPLANVQNAQEQARVLAAVDALPAHYRLPLVLRYFRDMDYARIAETLGVPRGQVGSLLFRARRQLRASLQGGEAR